MSKPLNDCRKAIEEWLRSVYINTAADVITPQGVVGNFVCEYHKNQGRADTGLTLASCVVRVYVSRAHEDSAHQHADEAQSDLQESLESFDGPWHQLLVASSDVAEENIAEATYTTVRFNVQIWV